MHLPSSSLSRARSRRAVRLVCLMLAASTLAGFAERRQAPVRTPRPRITGISHIALRVSDAAAARRFYGGTLGLSERAAADGTRLVFDVGSRQRVILEPNLRPGDDDRLLHLAFETPDLNALAEYLSARGVRVQKGGEEDASAIRVADPDGHNIEFVQADWPPPASTDSSARALSTRMLHAGLTVHDEQAAHAFYRDVLGFSEIWRGGRPEGVTQWINMRVPDGTEYLEYMLTPTRSDRARLGTMHHLCLLVRDMQATWEEVGRRAAGATSAVPGPPNVGVNGRWQLNLYDPDGTRVELMEPFRIR